MHIAPSIPFINFFYSLLLTKKNTEKGTLNMTEDTKFSKKNQTCSKQIEIKYKIMNS